MSSMSTEVTIPVAELVGRTAHFTRGQKYLGARLVTGIELAPDIHGGCQLRTRDRSPVPELTGVWLPECITPTNLADVHTTEADARRTVRDRKADAKARRDAAGPRMMAATDGNMLAMLVGATKVRAR